MLTRDYYIKYNKFPKLVKQRNDYMKTLTKIAVGNSCLIKLVHGEGRVRRRLFDMGVTPGIKVFVRKKAPLGDPIEITIRGYELTLRATEADLVEVEEI
jgi:Fe2+ transport system protein FeoA